jgi:hypothetical protein
MRSTTGRAEREVAMKRIVLLAVLASVTLSIVACAARPTDLRPIASTREGAEQFKDNSAD